jgi:hypothetical protein
MNATSALQQFQEQSETAIALFREQLLWSLGFGICLNILGAVVTFFVVRWFLLHVFEIQQKRFFAELDLFLYQRGIVPLVPESSSAGWPQQAVETSRVTEIAKDLVANLDTEPKQPKTSDPVELDQTPLERAWRELQNSGRPAVSSDDARFRPKE